jgi:hypothetical protein
VVLLFSGTAQNALPEPAQQAFRKYLADGGRLLLTGQDLSAGLSNTSFMRDVLHASLVDPSVDYRTTLRGAEDDPIGNGLGPFSIHGNPAHDNQRTPDALQATDSAAVPFLRWSTTFTKRWAALRVTSGSCRIVYYGFGIEGIPLEDLRLAMVQRTLAWLTRSAQERADRLLSLDGVLQEDYLEHLKGWSGFHDDGPPSQDLQDLVGRLPADSSFRDLKRRVLAER